MPRSRAFKQVDVFAGRSFGGNPVAVVFDADDVSTDEMQRFANWTNLSETTFVVSPTMPEADYRVRIFAPDRELPFAGHPTLGTCHAWLESGGVPADADTVVQECGVGLVAVRVGLEELAFAAPPMIKSGPVSGSELADAVMALGIDPTDVVASQWIDNGPGWLGILLADAEAVLAVDSVNLNGPCIGIAGMYPPGSEYAYEVRGFFPDGSVTIEDAVTGSLNASMAQWLIGENRVSAPYRVRQGTALGRFGVISISHTDTDTVWVGGATVTCIDATVQISH